MYKFFPSVTVPAKKETRTKKYHELPLTSPFSYKAHVPVTRRLGQIRSPTNASPPPASTEIFSNFYVVLNLN